MRSYWWLLLAGALCVVVGLWAGASSSRGHLAAPDAAAGGALAPFARGLNSVGDWADDVVRVATRRDDLASQNERLRRRVAALEAERGDSVRLRRENAELRRVLEMPTPAGGRSLPAEVLWAQNSEMARRYTLGVGAQAGVAPKDVVTAPEGLVGQITQTGPLTSVVTLFTDREGAVGAVVARSGVRGVVRGTGGETALLDYLPYSADVRAGDIVVTSGLVRGRGAVFPRGIPIGRVLRVEKDRAYSSQRAFIEPSVSFDRVSAVRVRAAQSAAQ